MKIGQKKSKFQTIGNSPCGLSDRGYATCVVIFNTKIMHMVLCNESTLKSVKKNVYLLLTYCY